MRKTPGQQDYSKDFRMSIGVVKNNADPAQHGRLQIFIPSIDSKYHNVEDLPWAMYASPFGGTTVDMKVGRENNLISGMSTYGFWAIPKIGAQVICGFLDGDPYNRYWIACIFMPELNRTMPQMIEGELTEIDESGLYPQKPVSFMQKNLSSAGLNQGTIHYKTRGGYERSISYPGNGTQPKKTTNGYAPKPLQPDASDSQTVCLTTPGRHYFVMSDVDEYCRIRLKTTEGTQVIFDDTNERIYISTARGKNWVELDEGNGKIYFYSDSKISIRSKNDINLYSDENVNIVANKRVNIKSETRSVNLEAQMDVRALSTQGDLMLTASRDITLKTTNGPTAAAVPEKGACSAGKAGWLYEWAEKAGSSTSSVRIDAAHSIEGAAKQNITLTSSSVFNARSMNGSINLQGSSSINMKTDGALNFTSTSVGLVSIDGLEGQEPIFAKNNAVGASSAGSAPTVASIKVTDHMILPDHEPWTRDEDESKCKTPRNKNYVG